MKVITFKIDDALLKNLNTYAVISGRSRSEVIRAALRKYLSEKLVALDAPPESRPVARKVVVVW